MENWLGNKTLLHSLLRQGDVANTINGGTSETFVAVENKENEAVILVSAAGVHSSDFKVRLQKNKLTIRDQFINCWTNLLYTWLCEK